MQIFENIIYYGSFLIFPAVFIIIWKRKKINKFLFIFLLVVCMIFIYARFIEPFILVTKHYNISVNKQIPNYKIALISDAHLGVYAKGNILKKAVNKINQENVDLVFIAGDFLNYCPKKKLSKYFTELSRLNALIYAVTGNHDHGLYTIDISQELIDELTKNNVKIIDDKTDEATATNGKAKIIGLSDLWIGFPQVSLTDLADPDNLTILLAHNPDVVYENGFNSKNIDLILAGHTHGGQIRIPFIYKSVIPTESYFNEGFYNIDNAILFISPGLGMVGLPMRFLKPPELDIITIN